MGGCLKLIGGLVVALVLLVIVATIFTRGSGTQTTGTETSAQPSSSAAKPAQAGQPADPNRGIKFGKPVSFGAGGVAMVGVPVTNTTDQVKSFTTKATYKSGDKILATAVGAVNDLPPGQTRAVSLISTESIPSTFDSVRIDVDTMVREAKTTSGAEAAAKIKFGPPSVKAEAGMTMVDVEVTNRDGAAHSFFVQVAFMKGDDLVGVATGAVNDLEGSATKTASLVGFGSTAGYDKTLVSVETLVK